MIIMLITRYTIAAGHLIYTYVQGELMRFAFHTRLPLYVTAKSRSIVRHLIASL